MRTAGARAVPLEEVLPGLVWRYPLMAIGRGLANPVWSPVFHVRDPMVLKGKEGYTVFHSRFEGKDWGSPANWSVRYAHTEDFSEFREVGAVTGPGYASPGDCVEWHGRRLIPCQSYPADPVRLCFCVEYGGEWSRPERFLEEAAGLAWNTRRRVIDPCLVVDAGDLHCFFVGTATPGGTWTNMVGHAVTTDPALERWEITSRDQPLIGPTADGPDGAENVTVFRTGKLWTMIYSEGLGNQHLARAVSSDLVRWERTGTVPVVPQAWMRGRHGAPFVWREDESTWLMCLMGEDMSRHAAIGLLESADGKAWRLLPCSSASRSGGIPGK